MGQSNLYSLNYSEKKTYILATAFVAGNIILPQICHLIPQGGLIFLPIYFFTLISAYKYGWKVGLITAVMSPIINHLLFGMPAISVLAPILIKSIFLAIAAGTCANYFKRVNILIMMLVVLSYQLFGTLVEWSIVKDFHLAIQDFRIGIPGMIIQILGGYFLIKYLSK